MTPEQEATKKVTDWIEEFAFLFHQVADVILRTNLAIRDFDDAYRANERR